MVQAVVAGVVLGGLGALGLRWRAKRGKQREAQRRERLAVIVMYVEMTAAIAAIDLALRDGGSRWLASMSESRTLAEAWRDHGEALVGLGSHRWEALSDAVTAVAPNYTLRSIRAQTQTEEFRRSLSERRQALVEGAEILLVVQKERTADGSVRSGDARRPLV